jgi:hypothetical protein
LGSNRQYEERSKENVLTRQTRHKCIIRHLFNLLSPRKSRGRRPTDTTTLYQDYQRPTIHKMSPFDMVLFELQSFLPSRAWFVDCLSNRWSVYRCHPQRAGPCQCGAADDSLSPTPLCDHSFCKNASCPSTSPSGFHPGATARQ